MKETHSVIGSFSVLAFTLIFIYVIFFGVKGKSLTQNIVAGNIDAVTATGTTFVTSSTSGSNENEQGDHVLEDNGKIPTTEPETVEKIPPKEQIVENKTFFSVQQLFQKNNIKEDNVLILRDDMRQRKPNKPVSSAGLKSLESVGIQDFGKYIIKDIQNTHYVYLGRVEKKSLKQRIEQTISPKGGNILEISDKTLINQSHWTGDEVWEVMTPYADAKDKMLAVLFFNGAEDVWFLQIDNEVLETKKFEIKAIFESLY